MRLLTFAAVSAFCLIGNACQSTPSVGESESEGNSGHFPPECESDEDCAPDEICVEDFSNYCDPSCEARQPNLDFCGCAEGRYCEPGDNCPTIGCDGGQLCTSGECHDVGLAPECADPTWWSFGGFEAEAGSGVVAIQLTQMSPDASPELVMLRPGSVEINGLGGGMLALPGTENATMIRAGNIDAENGDDLLIADSDAAWLYASAPMNFDDPTLTLELAATLPMVNLVHVEVGDFGGSPDLDVWLQGSPNFELHLGNGDFGFQPLSIEQDYLPSTGWAVGDLDLDGRDDLTWGGRVWLGAETPEWTSPSLVLDPPAWLGPGQTEPLAIPEGLAIAWTIGTTNDADDPQEPYTALASYPALGAPSADAVLYPGHPRRLIAPPDVVDQGFTAIEGDEIVVYRELDGQHCRAVTSGNGFYVDGYLDPTDSNRMILLTADGAVEEWLRL